MLSTRRGLLFLVDDDPALTALVAELLRHDGWAVSCFDRGEACLQALQEATPSCVLLDLQMPGLTGQATLQRIAALYRHLPVIVLTADREVSTVVELLRLGAYDFLAKPVEPAKLLTAVSRAAEKYQLSVRVAQLERQHESRGFPGLVGSSAPMQHLVRQIERVASTDVTVHVHGESGTGKELVARAIHENSGRRGKPFVAINCGALTESLQESELFGHEKGAFTGAVARKAGHFEAVQGGTLFLDEVAELSPSAQARLLRVLQERVVQRVGGSESIPVDFRLLTATHRDLNEAVQRGAFREDLLFRILVYELELPPLRERSDDLVMLARHFVALHGPKLAGRTPDWDEAALDALRRHRWPGNVRELENVVQRALVNSTGDRLAVQDLPKWAVAVEPPPRASAPTPESNEPVTLEASERAQIVAALERC
ncbi:MAG TPA: sigma-54 dependent transcriptional regulator, partial [Archangium sp.]